MLPHYGLLYNKINVAQSHQQRAFGRHHHHQRHQPANMCAIEWCLIKFKATTKAFIHTQSDNNIIEHSVTQSGAEDCLKAKEYTSTC